MTGFCTAAKSTFRKMIAKMPTRQLTAILLLLTLIIPVAMPIPAWAYGLNTKPAVDDGLRLTSTDGSLTTSLANLTSNLFKGIATFVSPIGGDKKKSEKAGSATLKALAGTVAKIETQFTDEITVRVGDSLALSAIPLDKKGRVVNGIGSYWTSSDSDIVSVADERGLARKEGIADLIVRSGNISKTLKITVAGTGSKPNSVIAAPPAAMPDDDDEFRSSFTPENNLGSPYGQVEAQAPSGAAALRGPKRRFLERVGSANFSFEVPVAAIPGRGIDAGISLSYNSRVWEMWNNPLIPANSRYFYNKDGDWLAPGFKLTFGSLQFAGSRGSLISRDGTRHEFFLLSGDNYHKIYETMDGTFIRVHVTLSGPYRNNTALVKYPDGSTVTYSSLETGPSHYRFSPTKIVDRNGNINQIAYKQNDTKGRIWYIRDTLNRYINFHYDGNKLVAVTVPGFDGGNERQTIRFYYETMNFDTTTPRFQGVNHTIPASADVLKYIYFPGTNTGYKYEYSPAWGMMYKISDLRGIQVSTLSLTETGIVTSEGQTAATSEYNYPSALTTPLTNVPAYTTRTDDWTGRTTATAPITLYYIEKDTVNNRTITSIKSPDGTITETWAKIAPNAWDDGLVTDTFIKTVISMQQQTYKTWAYAKMFWENQAGATGRKNPKIVKIEQTNDADQTKATTFEYDSYNNQTASKEHDFATPGSLGTELRKTEITYETGAGWISNRLISLPKSIKTKVNSVIVSRTDFEYDGPPLLQYGSEPITQHDPSYNTGIPDGQYCYEVCPVECQDPQFPGGCNCQPVEVCDPVPVFNPATNYRGNITEITAFSDASLPADPNATVSTMKYDVTGNVVETSSSCCELKTTEYITGNHYAYPMSETRTGDDLQFTTSATYDLNTGLVKTATDENNQSSTMMYDSSNLRLTRADSPGGAWATREYNDATYPYFVKTTSSLDANHSVSGWSFSDGLGQGFRSRSQTTNGYISSDVEFDAIGSPVKSYSPYTVSSLNDSRPGDIKFTQITQRDGLGRTLSATLPDLTTVTTSYNGLVATATDQAGKSRRQIADALGRTVRVDEPNSNGQLDVGGVPIQPTYYEYDGNDNLTRVIQTEGMVTQERLFKYDSLSRLTHERQIEATATLNDEGVKVLSGGLWTGIYKYDAESLLLEGVDARGVKTAFTYDGLNRIKTVTYTSEAEYQTPMVTYTYDEPESGFYNGGRLTKVQTAANATYGTPETTQNYRYNKIGQVVKHIQSIGNQNYQLEYDYNLAGQLVSEKYPSGKVVNMTVDNFGRLSVIADDQRTFLNGVTFDNRGLLTQVNLGNGTSETFAYNDRFQIESQSLLKGTDVLQRYDYSYGKADLATGAIDATKNNGQLAAIEGWIGTNKQWSQRFGYDELGRLSETGEYKQGDNQQLTYKQKFDFDRWGNLYRKAVSNPTAGQQNPLPYTPIEETDISKSTNQFTTDTTYDDAGNVVVDNKFRQMGFAYDANGRQVKATKSGVLDAWTVYDALGNRVATKINNVWQYMIYDAFGKLVAEYGLSSPNSDGINYVHQDWQGSVRTLTSNTGFVVSRTDHQAFGDEIGAGIGLRIAQQSYGVASPARQGYGRTEKDDATGLNHTWFRKNENGAGRWTSPDPYKASMLVSDPQSFNRYSYVTNDPVNFVDPTGLYTACAHQAMTKFLAELAGFDSYEAGQIAGYAGGGPEGADETKHAATGPFNWVESLFTRDGDAHNLHFPSAARLKSERANFQGYVAQGRSGRRDSWMGYQAAGFVLHAIQDGLGAHAGFSLPLGHGPATAGAAIGLGGSLLGFTDPDTVLGDSKFITAANETYKTLTNNKFAGLTSQQLNDLIDAIVKACGDDFKISRPRPWRPRGGARGGSGFRFLSRRGGGGGGGFGSFGWLRIYHGADSDTVYL